MVRRVQPAAYHEKFRFIYIDEKLQIVVRVLELDPLKVHDYVCANLFGGLNDRHKGYLDCMGSILHKLRLMFVYLKEKEWWMHGLSFFQPIFILFLEQCMVKLECNWCHQLGSALSYSLPVKVHELTTMKN